LNIRPNIAGGMGAITPRAWNKIASVVNRNEPAIDQSRNQRKAQQVFLAKITGNNTIISNRRWSYTWTTAAFDVTTNKFKAAIGTALISDTNQLAYNTVEGLQQDSGTKNGPGVLHANIVAAGYALQPIATGTYVLLFGTADSTGKQIYVFSVANAIDGSCA
jgi:hypothetical protein